MAVNPNIQKKADDIRNKIYGKDVRESLASGLEAMSSDVVDTVDRQGAVEEQFQDVIDNTTDKDVISAPEIIAARNGEANLKARLDKENQEVKTQMAETATQTDLSNLSELVSRKAFQSDLEVEKSRIDNLTANAGNTDNNAELIDIRVGYDGVTYTTAGEAVRQTIGAYMTEENEIWEVV